MALNVTCAIIKKDERILVVQRGINMRLPLKWEFPGGKIEEAETEEECIIREIKEELNIEIQLVSRLTPCCYNYGDFSIRLIPFIANYLSGEIKLAEHKQYLYLQKEELAKMDWAEADIPIVNQLLSL
ncbi:MAG: (deoxy)nucleoside triphosphate pyrophosphohydrolase [Saprospiraceae bacterium]|nr:(deoxy)nucleoside triphosphate pyrophosphohydrolase [Saprospiraceae bacterium]MBK8668591.1 (deoxy)nucleoside triphosphate pyrophosphohydrolase [Saprospiraceae bacterium]MBL0100853.1 (deoxy)nucleoside triphosphate pyrophosphohydrolase [Saprospiraceae bacterium]